MNYRLLTRRKISAVLGLVLCALGVLPRFIEHHPLGRDAYPGVAVSELSVAATHAGATQHCEASKTELRESCVACLLQRRAAAGQLPEIPLIDAALATREAYAPAEQFLRSSLLPPAGGRAPPEV